MPDYRGGNGTRWQQKSLPTTKTLNKTCQYKTSQDSSGPLLTENNAVLIEWTEYYKDLYNFQLKKQNKTTKTSELADQPVLREEVERIVCRLKGGKSPGVDNVPAEPLKQGEEETTNAFPALWSQRMDAVTCPTLHKKENELP